MRLIREKVLNTHLEAYGGQTVAVVESRSTQCVVLLLDGRMRTVPTDWLSPVAQMSRRAEQALEALERALPGWSVSCDGAPGSALVRAVASRDGCEAPLVIDGPADALLAALGAGEREARRLAAAVWDAAGRSGRPGVEDDRDLSEVCAAAAQTVRLALDDLNVANGNVAARAESAERALRRLSRASRAVEGADDGALAEVTPQAARAVADRRGWEEEECDGLDTTRWVMMRHPSAPNPPPRVGRRRVGHGARPLLPVRGGHARRREPRRAARGDDGRGRAGSGVRAARDSEATEPGSLAATIDRVLRDTAFRDEVARYVAWRDGVRRELDEAERGALAPSGWEAHGPAQDLRCVGTERFAVSEDSPGFMVARFALPSFVARMLVTPAGAKLIGYDPLCHASDSGLRRSPPPIGAEPGKMDLDAVGHAGIAWSARVPKLWHALALAYETHRPEVCGACLSAKRNCGCAR